MKSNVACFYSFAETWIMQGHVSEEKKLCLTVKDNYKNHSVSEVVKILDTYHKDSMIYSNKHEPLTSAAKYIREFDIQGENSKEVDALSDAWESLRKENRFVANGFRMQSKDNFSSECCCLKILLKSFTGQLFRKSSGFLPSATVAPRKKNFYARRAFF